MATMALIISFMLLRLEQLRLTHLGWSRAIQTGLLAGLLADIALVLCATALRGFLCSFESRLGKWLSSLLSFCLWALLAANVSYFAFFQSELYLWVANSYSENAWSVRGMALKLLEHPYIVASFAAMILSLFFASTARTKHVPRLKQAAPAILLFAAALVIKQAPHWTWLHIPQVSESIFSNNMAWRWIDDLKDGKLKVRVPIEKYKSILPEAPHLLAQYAKGISRGPTSLPTSSPMRSKENDDSRQRAEISRKLREMLGFSPQQKLNYIILFLESGRAYELLSPKTAQSIYPEFRSVLARHGILFSQTYSMASVTVQGQFSTLCSRMDRFDSAPTYSRQPYAKVECLPSVFKEQGYETYWMNPFHRYFAGKYVFESNHGTKHFLDREFFVPRTPEEAQESREWGVSDETFLSQAMEKLESIHSEGKPFFAHLLTTGTHVPWQPLPKFPLSENMKSWSKGSVDYAGYLSTAKALDHALGIFFDRFFNSPLSKDTVVVVLGDHGTGVVPPNAQLTSLQSNLIWPRIIMGVISKNMSRPKVVNYPVHQMDIAPLLTAIEGLPQPASWQGREPLLSGRGTLWVKRNGNRFFYRLRNRLCGKLMSAQPLQCWQFRPEQDPLFETSGHLIGENPSQTQWFKSVIEANEAIMELAGGDASELSQHL